MIRMISPVYLDDPQDMALLRALINSNKLCQKWEKGRLFSVPDILDPMTQKPQKIQLTHDIMLSSPINGNLSFHVIANTVLGEGGFGSVSPVELTLSFLDETTIDYSNQMRVAKIQSQRYSNVNEMNKIINNFRHEFFMTKQLKHLNADGDEPIINSANGSVKFSMVIDRLDGLDLYDLMDVMYQCDSKPSSQFRMILTIAIIEAFKDQIVANYILHADVKPENIMIDMGLTKLRVQRGIPEDFCPDYVKAFFIDVATSRKYGVRIDKRCGLSITPRYCAPELLPPRTLEQFFNEKHDMYSLGIILNEIWGFGEAPILPKDHKYYSILIDDIHKSCFEGEDSFSKEMLEQIYNVIINMTYENFNARWSIQKTLEAFAEIQQNLKNEDIEDEYDLNELRITSEMTDCGESPFVAPSSPDRFFAPSPQHMMFFGGRPKTAVQDSALETIDEEVPPPPAGAPPSLKMGRSGSWSD